MNNGLIYRNFVLSVTGSIKNFNKASCEGAVTSGSWGFGIMKRIEYVSGQLLGECIYLYETEMRGTYRHAMFKCKKCNTAFEARIDSIKSRNGKSCGCYQKTKASTHNLYKHRLYNVWIDLKGRCCNKSNLSYHDYGGRGITVCDEWKNDFKAFYNYVIRLEHYNEPGMTLDRRRNNEGYKPGNLRWADRRMQILNRRKNKNNTSGYVGVSKKRNKWISVIMVDGNTIRFGSFITKHDALNARNRYIIDNNLTEYKIQEYV